MPVIILVDSPLPDGEDWWMETLLLFGVVVSVGAVWLLNPALVFELEARGQQALSFADSGDVDSLEISSDDVGFMNRLYRERTHEVGYCGMVSNGEMDIWTGDTINASGSHVVFSTSNCPFISVDALLHSHPSGSLELSETDKETFVGSDLRYSCIHGGPIPTDLGSDAVNLQCYEKPESGDVGDEFPSVSVKVVE